jgi:hypothetical protein
MPLQKSRKIGNEIKWSRKHLQSETLKRNFGREIHPLTLEGIHPTLRQVPPNEPRPSTQVTFMPSCPALIAATYPPGPPPITTRSYRLPNLQKAGSLNSLSGTYTH